MNIIFLGDVFGKPGRELVLTQLDSLREKYNPDVIIINGENLADGRGLTEKTTKPLFEAGITSVTSGNHLWDRSEALEYLARENRIIKPLNYPSGALGSPFFQVKTDVINLTILCLTGQAYMPSCDSPYTAMENFLASHNDLTGPILVDFHAESTAEKRAFAFMFEGKISAVIGTHTHIQTADEEILPQGTGYITDVGMTGPHDSVIGVKKQLIIDKMRTGMPVRYEVANSGMQLNGIFLNINQRTRRTEQIIRIREIFQD
ncbi:MAG TPA: TIGR00282 family metallophosphoesterase [Candidatus Cloacimonadota bacterium]|nr:TIGR00282 family metallophosphoesterase [Candidatus Cloacimonadota bacterium]